MNQKLLNWFIEIIWYLGSISPNFLRQAKVGDAQSLAKNLPCSFTTSETAEFCQTTVLKFAKQLYWILPNNCLNFAKQLYWILPNNCAEFCQIISPFTKYVCRLPNTGKCFSSCLVEKAASICWWNRPQPSISSTFYACIFHTKVLCEAFFYLHVTREKLPKRLLYKNAHVKCWWNRHLACEIVL